jgi:hypothetical protein
LFLSSFRPKGDEFAATERRFGIITSNIVCRFSGLFRQDQGDGSLNLSVAKFSEQRLVTASQNPGTDTLP